MLTTARRLPGIRGTAAALVAALLSTFALATPATTSSVELPSVPSVAAFVSDTTVDPAVHAALANSGTADVLVRTTPGSRDLAAAAIRSHGGSVALELDLVDALAGTITSEGLEALTAITGVVAVSEDGEVALSHTEADGSAPSDSSYVETVGADALHAQGIDGSGVGIAIIDTGVSEVADLAGRVVGGANFSGSSTSADEYGHGTFIAGIAAGDGASSNGEHAGVAPGAHVVPVKIAGRNGASDISHVLAAIQWVVVHKDVHDIDVLNLSLGTDSTQPQMLSPLNYAVEQAWDAGITVVVSGGNHGEEGPGRIPKPADDPLVITVGATDSMGTVDRADDRVAGYSSLGPSIADGFEKPDLVAPGSHLVSVVAPGSALATQHTSSHLGNGYARGSGTSFAAAVTSGAAALLLQANPTWTPDQVKQALTSSAAPGPVGHRNVDGHGALDVPAAAAATVAPDSQGLVVRSTGVGSLELDRGTLKINVSTSGLFNTLAWLLGQVVTLGSETTAQLQTFDATEFTGSAWYGSAWYGSAWYGSAWYGSAWYGSAWYGSAWYGSAWYGSAWYGSAWYHDGWQ